MSNEDRDTPSDHRYSIQVFRLVRDKERVTARDVADYCGVSVPSANRKLRQMRDAEILGVKGYRAYGRARAKEYGFGADEVASQKRDKPTLELIVFKALLRNLEEASTKSCLVEEVGINRRTAELFIRCARAWRIVYVSKWVKAGTSNTWAPCWKLGSHGDALRPEPEPRKVINARQYIKRAERIRVQQIQQALTQPIAA